MFIMFEIHFEKGEEKLTEEKVPCTIPVLSSRCE